MVTQIRLAFGIVLLALLALPLDPAYAHASLVSSEPAAESVIPVAPATVALSFSESIDPGFTRAEVFNASGARVDQGDSRVESGDPLILRLSLNQPLPPGVYTVAWRALSNVDGHVTEGFFSFGVGDINEPLPASSQSSAPPPDVLAAESVARWLNLLAATVVVGGPVFLALVWRPAWRKAGLQPAEPLERTGRLIRAALGLLLLALLALLFVQAAAVAGGGLVAGVNSEQVVRLVTDSRFGAVWLARVLLAVALLALGAGSARGLAGRRALAAAALGALLLLTSALVSHAAAAPRPLLPLLIDWVHLAATAVWGGGLVFMVVHLATAYRTLAPADCTRLAAAVVPPFSTLALVTVSVLMLTGILQASQHVFGLDLGLLVGAESPLLTTDYGRTLLVKLLLIVPLLATAAVNLLIIGPRLNAAARHQLDAAATRRLLLRTIGVEIVLITAILLAVGRLTSLPPARQAATETSGLSFQGQADTLNVTLTVAPGRVGANQFAVTLADAAGAPYDAARDVSLRFQPLGGSNLGTSIATLAPQGGGRYTASGTYLSLAGRWALEVAVRRPDAFDAFARFEAEVTPSSAQAVNNQPGAFRFRWPMLNGLLIALIGALLGVVAWVQAPRELPRAGRLALAPALALGLLLPGALTIYQGFQTPRDEIINPLAGNPEAISAGRQIYVQNCVVCHGVEGRGNGPAAIALNPRPSDFCLHMQPGVHKDIQIFDWIASGYPNSAMPAWKGRLTDEQIWQTFAFLKAEFGKPECAGGQTPAAIPAVTPTLTP